MIQFLFILDNGVDKTTYITFQVTQVWF